MSTLRPFRAYRPALGLEEKIAALPYDVYNREEAKAVVEKNPMSFLAIDRAETFFEKEISTYDDAVYKKASDELKRRIQNGDWKQDEKPCFYLYELTMNGRSQTGFVGCASVEEYEKSIIKKHENTRADKEQDRIRHVETCGMQTGPIFLSYKQNDFLKNIINDIKKNTPVYDFVSDDGIGHKVWVVCDDDVIKNIESGFAKVDSLYIADGHHRCASAVRVGVNKRNLTGDCTAESNYILSVVFADEELKIFDYNRVIKDLNGYTSPEFLEKIKEIFDICDISAEPVKPARKGEFGMYLDGEWYRLVLKDYYKSEDAVAGLDVSILQDNLLGPVLGIKDPKTDNRIDFVGGIRGLKELERRCKLDCVVAFSMFPTSMEELFRVADSGLLMPPKSTWFEPKLRSGLFLHEI